MGSGQYGKLLRWRFQMVWIPLESRCGKWARARNHNEDGTPRRRVAGTRIQVRGRRSNREPCLTQENVEATAENVKRVENRVPTSDGSCDIFYVSQDAWWQWQD